MAGLFGEFKRRNIFNVGAAYLIVASPVPQAAAAAFPSWTVTFVTVLGDSFWQYVGTIEPNVYL